ncbi:uncharacterized protein BJ171DRAFT_573246 [Polychytrium aggregatum]|uniref:uncharacterized protein n=1 Tax=Polychytrium aggregatum TaxID=110093 RepID=UPI0022FDF6E4|nr:uncharacterized protein BJ171DRAFT_573246 [Polychytrium aggregatum]KAI9193069.1 hypothetical protein BJ171DRAFT_573246 [Polychytrium aggregatum]
MSAPLQAPRKTPGRRMMERLVPLARSPSKPPPKSLPPPKESADQKEPDPPVYFELVPAGDPARISLLPVTSLNYYSLGSLSVAADQEQHIPSNWKSIAQGFYEPDAWIRGIYFTPNKKIAYPSGPSQAVATLIQNLSSPTPAVHSTLHPTRRASALKSLATFSSLPSLSSVLFQQPGAQSSARGSEPLLSPAQQLSLNPQEDAVPVGLVMLSLPENIQTRNPFLWRLMIDKRYQGKGFGRKAVELVRNEVLKFLPEATHLDTCCKISHLDSSPLAFFHKVGFVQKPPSPSESDIADLVLDLFDGFEE